MIKKSTKKERRKKRHFRVRSIVSGTSKCPRLSVYKSNKHIYAQIINDIDGKTLVSVSTLQPSLKSKLKSTWNKKAAELIGELIAKSALEKGVKEVVFDRGGNRYHGKVLALAEKARSGGLSF